MNRRRKTFLGYTLLELLIVMAIFIILGALGVGGYLGTRETMIAKENVQTVIQDIRSARLKSMLLEKGDDDNWIYGIGIDFYSMSPALEGATTFFKWCSPFEDFGNEISKSDVLGFVESEGMGEDIEISSVLGASTDIMAAVTQPPTKPPYIPPYIPPPVNTCTQIQYNVPWCTTWTAVSPSCCTCLVVAKTSCTNNCCYCSSNVYKYSCLPADKCCQCISTHMATSCINDDCCVCTAIRYESSCPAGDKCCKISGTIVPTPPVVPTFKNGYLSTVETTTCVDKETSLVKITGNELGVFSTVEGVQLMGARYLVFEAITGRAFLYADDGSPVNYDLDGDFTSNSVTTLDIIFERKSSSKFDMVSIYPLSGTVIHHVYSNADKNPACTAPTSDCIVLNGVGYDRYDIADEINSYR